MLGLMIVVKAVAQNVTWGNLGDNLSLAAVLAAAYAPLPIIFLCAR